MQLLYFQLQFGVCCKIQSSGEYQKGFEVQNHVFPAPPPHHSYYSHSLLLCCCYLWKTLFYSEQGGELKPAQNILSRSIKVLYEWNLKLKSTLCLRDYEKAKQFYLSTSSICTLQLWLLTFYKI